MNTQGEMTTSAVDDPPVPLEREWVDDALHYGRAWHRYRYCHRHSTALKVLDAGCGAGRSSAWISMLNPGASVLGMDVSPTLIDMATASNSSQKARLEFREGDLTGPIDSGPFDFIVCRKVLGEAIDPVRIISNLAKSLKPDGLLFLTLPSKRGREAARILRRVVDVFASPGMDLADRSRIALEVYRGLRSDHPLRLEIIEKVGSRPETFLLDYLNDTQSWSLNEAIRLLEGAGLQLLHTANPPAWRPERVFTDPALEDGLESRYQKLDPQKVSRLIDALDPAASQQDHLLYACPASHRPLIPDWVAHPNRPELFERLIPHSTGIARPLENEGRSFPAGRVLYQTVSGAVGELDRLSNLMLLDSDGRRTIAEINGRLAGRTRAGDNEKARREAWLNLADSGLVVLEPTDA